MKDSIWQKRQFLLSSFARLHISIKTEVYRYVDHIVQMNIECPSDLSELDKFIFEDYRRYLNEQR
jgi:hypothetical protein